MAEIIDVLTPLHEFCPEVTVVAPATAGHLAVKPVYPSALATSYKLYVDGSGMGAVYGKFQKRDNIRLLTAGFYIPESFTLSSQWDGQVSPAHKVSTSIAANELMINVLKSDNSTSVPLPGLGARGVIGLPFANYETAFDIFSDMSKPAIVPLLADNEYFLTAQLFLADVSMIGVPTLLNGQVIRIVPFIKILHTLPIIA